MMIPWAAVGFGDVAVLESLQLLQVTPSNSWLTKLDFGNILTLFGLLLVPRLG